MEMGGKKQVLDGSLLVSCESSAAPWDLTQTGFPKVAAGVFLLPKAGLGLPRAPRLSHTQQGGKCRVHRAGPLSTG